MEAEKKIVEEVETDSIENIEQFCKIISLLNDKNVAILNQCLKLEGWKEKQDYLQTFRNPNDLESYYALYCAYIQRDLVLNPIEYLKDDIIKRFNRLYCI